MLQVQELQSPLTDGWGICTDGKSLIVSDSTPTLAWLDPKTLNKQRTVQVHDEEYLVPWVNEVCCTRNQIEFICNLQVSSRRLNSSAQWTCTTGNTSCPG